MSPPAAQDWGAIVSPHANPQHQPLSYCDVRYGVTQCAAALEFQSANAGSTTPSSAAPITDRLPGHGLATLSNTSIEACVMTPIVLDFTATPVLSSLVFSSSNNGYDAFGLRGGTISSAASLAAARRHGSARIPGHAT